MKIWIFDFKIGDEVLYNAAIILNQENRLKAIKEVLNMHSIIDMDIDLETLLIYTNPSGWLLYHAVP